jgi:hypothetical protein
LKRKSPDVSRKQRHDVQPEELYQDEGAETDRSTQKRYYARKSKAQKYSQGDSPGAVERKRTASAEPKSVTKSKSPKHLALPRPPHALRRVPNLKKKSSPFSKIRRSKAELSSDNMMDDSPEPSRLSESKHFYLQCEPQLNPTADSDAVIVSPGKGWGFNGEENIPPIPPMPHGLTGHNGKGDIKCSGGLEHSRDSRQNSGHMPLRSLCQEPHIQRKVSDNFEWPDDIF